VFLWTKPPCAEAAIDEFHAPDEADDIRNRRTIGIREPTHQHYPRATDSRWARSPIQAKYRFDGMVNYDPAVWPAGNRSRLRINFNFTDLTNNSPGILTFCG
jgi:hypothetical protein